MSKKSRERKERKVREQEARRAALAEAAERRRAAPDASAPKPAPPPEGAVTRYHATTKAVVPEDSDAPVELLPADAHGDITVWPEKTAPRHLVYLGDAATALVFMGHAAEAHQAEPVLLEVTLDASTLEPDPAYLESVRRLALFGDKRCGSSASESLFWSGRVAVAGPVEVARRLHVLSGKALANLVIQSRIGEHAERWHDDSIWQQAARENRARAESGAQWRARVGRYALSQLFVEY
jgi:hypothetical protein